MLLSLLRPAISGKAVELCAVEGASAEQWTACYQTACKQGVMAMAFEGVMTLPEELLPPRQLKITWALAVEKHERRYRRYCLTVKKLSDFYAEHGIAMVQLKGSGLSTYYTTPSHREFGDIDIFTFSADRSKMSDAEAHALANTLMKQQGIELVGEHDSKHCLFYYEGIPVENHKNFLPLSTYKFAVPADDYLLRSLAPESAKLLDGECRILIPSPQFNALFTLLHAMQHYCNSISLHHVCDWGRVLMLHGFEMPAELNNKHLARAAAAFARLTKLMGVDTPIAGDDDLADAMIREVFHPAFPENKAPKGKLFILVYKTRRMLHQHRLSNKVLGASLLRRVWHSILYHLREPQTIFVTGKG